MASGKSLSFKIVKVILVLMSVLMIIGSFYVGTASSKYIKEEKDAENSKNSYTLRIMKLNFWSFISVVTLALQDFSALVGIFGTFKESYELTFTYSLLTFGVFVLNLINPSLLPTIVGPIFGAIVMCNAFLFSRYLKNIQYNITTSKSKPESKSNA